MAGWKDLGLEPFSEEISKNTGRALSNIGYNFSHVFCSDLIRTKKTAELLLKGMGQENKPINNCWELNDRHFGQI